MEIQATAQRLLEKTSDPVVRARLLREVLRRPPNDPELNASRLAAASSPQVQALVETQQADGGWVRFHSMDSRKRRAVPTTEWAVERARALGLDASQPPLKNAARYIYDLLTWKLEFPDPPEMNNRWPVGVRLFLAGTLARVQPRSPILIKERHLWRRIAEIAFARGQYDERAEEAAHRRLTGISVTRSYLVLNGRYQLQLLGSQPDTLPGELQAQLLRWLWKLPQGIGYLGVPLAAPPGDAASSIDRWLASHALLAEYFAGWADLAGPVLAWLWAERRPEGLWDFGPRPPRTPYLPLAESWHNSGNRAVDWSVRVLLLFARYLSRQRSSHAELAGA